MISDQPTKKCIRCELTKTAEHFHKNKKNKDGLNSYCKECRSKQWTENLNGNRGRIAKYRATINGRAVHLLKDARVRAERTGVEFSLSLIRISFALTLGTCERSGVQFDLSKHIKHTNHPFSPSIDKIDPFKGYTDDNIKVVSTAYNFGKMQMTHSEYVEFCKRVVEFNK